MAKKNNYYAIKKGFDKKNNIPVEYVIVESWGEAQQLVIGTNGAIYKGFPTLKEAEIYLESEDPLMNKSDGKYPKNCLHCYVDGSFNKDIKNYGLGVVCVKEEKVISIIKEPGNNDDATSMQQIGGELLGAVHAVLFAKDNGYKEVVIFHDYKGVCYHAIGYWERDNFYSKRYYDYMQHFFSENPDIKVHFCKVDAHTGDDFNEIADGLAKQSIGIAPESKFFTLAKHYNIEHML